MTSNSKANKHVTNPKKLLHSKWTAVTPANKEKHFMVTKLMLETAQTEQTSIEIMHFVMIEAIHSKRTQTIQW